MCSSDLLLVPRLKACAAKHPALGSRIVNVASMAHALPKPIGPARLDVNKKYFNRKGGPFWAYGRSKRANVLSAMSFASRLEGTGVTALSLCPGNVRTNLGQSNFAGEGHRLCAVRTSVLARGLLTWAAGLKRQQPVPYC